MKRLALTVALAILSPACTETSGPEDAGPDAGADAGTAPVWVVEADLPTTEDLFGVWGRSRDDVWAVGWNGTIIHWDGVAWTKETTTATVTLQDVHGLVRDEGPMPGDPIFAVGWGGTILRRSDDGTWAEEVIVDDMGVVTTTVTQELFGVYVGAEDNALAVGARGRVIGWDGAAWTLVRFSVPGEFSGQPIEPLGVLKGVWSSSGERYYISGSGGAAYRSSGGFAAFEALDTRVNQPLRGVFGFPGGPVYTVGLDSLILRWTGEWRRVTDDGARELPNAFFFDVAGASPDDLTVVGWRGVIARYLNGTWTVEPSGTTVDLRALWIDPTTGTAFAVGASGTMLRRDPPPIDAGVGDAG
ncbi:hypothetical protein L6R52_09080 [Myxococcota bacterium]|nr:hypothetical protein [Myxococcota bacterium]